MEGEAADVAHSHGARTLAIFRDDQRLRRRLGRALREHWRHLSRGKKGENYSSEL